MRLKDKVSIITGSASGIGFAAACKFAAEGAHVMVCDLNREQVDKAVEEIRAAGGSSQGYVMNVTDRSSIDAMVADVKARYGRIDVLVNNAGVATSVDDPSIDRWLAVWNHTLDVNLRAAALLCRLATDHFTANGGGRIINISSRAAFRGDQPDYIAYAASKGGMVALTRSIARGFGKQGIVAFNVAPGFTRTAMAQDFIDQYGEDYPVSDIALSRLTEPKDIAPTVVFLASGLADHATGATIDINAASYVH